MFEVFARISGKVKESRTGISINHKGRVGISRRAFEKWFTDSNYVLKAYDREKKRIRLKTIKDKEPNAFKITKQVSKKGYTSYHFNAKSFINHYQITPVKSLNPYEEEEFVVIDAGA